MTPVNMSTSARGATDLAPPGRTSTRRGDPVQHPTSIHDDASTPKLTRTGAPIGTAPSWTALTDPRLRHDLLQLARQPRLLVACDYDGTLAAIVPDFRSVRPLPESVAALRVLASLPETTAAVISGRALRELAAMSRLPSEVHLIGSHGSEFDIGFAYALDERASALHARIVEALQGITRDAPGVLLEVKPASVAVHVRQAEPPVANQALAEIAAGPARWDGVSVTHGNAVTELAVIPTDKGDALEVLRQTCGATAAIFLGDDLSAEEAFSRLAGPDVGVKVGAGDTIAPFRVADSTAVAEVLAFLANERRAWIFGEEPVPIERLSMLGNGLSLALVTPDARICWQCSPGPASASIFAELLGGPSAGHFSIRPLRDCLPLGQRYVPGTMTLQTRWPGLMVTDYLDHNTEPHRTDLVRVISGSARTLIEFAPRPEFGQAPVRLQPVSDGLAVTGIPDPIVLRAPGLRWTISTQGPHQSARAVAEPSQDQPVILELRCGTRDVSAHSLPEPQRRALSGAHWSRWAAQLRLPAVEPALVARSALTLRALCHAGTGAILAAATTSLPESMGGIRNWDYRHCWLRDAALTARALVSLGSGAEACAYLDWVHRVLAGVQSPERLHPVYALDGGTPGAEAVIHTLPGYGGSRPVRVGNLAERQVQLDVFGPIVELIADLADHRHELEDADWNLVVAMCRAVARRWHEPDHGIWEERTIPRHHVHSKVMCWVAVDRAIRLAARYGRDADPAWPALRNVIARDVLENGWKEEVKAFTTAYDGTDLDAASLHIGLTGLVDPGDERFQATVGAVEAELRYGPTVYRYRRDDALPGAEGGFHLCTTWLIEAYLLTGRRGDAEELFAHYVDAVGPTGLLPEEFDPIAERSLGNHPQAYSHLGLIRCAQLLDAAGQNELPTYLPEMYNT